MTEAQLEFERAKGRTAIAQLDEACRQNSELRERIVAMEEQVARYRGELARIAKAEPHVIPATAAGEGIAQCPGCIRFQHWAAASLM